jgi:membrane protein DedA with SNARE-associated domain
MPELSGLIGHWGYLAIFLLVICGNVGLPVPEETTLALAGYLAWQGQLQLAAVLAVGVISATAGDNLGYWIGRRYGRGTIERYEAWILASPGRPQAVGRFVTRYGLVGVFAARFIPGLRFLAGPLAGAAGLRFVPFTAANVLGAIVYVPYAVGIGYAIGYGVGPYVARFQHTLGVGEPAILLIVMMFLVALLGWRVLRAYRPSPKA